MPLCLPKENATAGKERYRRNSDKIQSHTSMYSFQTCEKTRLQHVLFFKTGPVVSKPGFFTSSKTSKIPIKFSQQAFFIMSLTLAHYILTEMATATDQTLTNNYNKLNKKVKTFIIQ